LVDWRARLRPGAAAFSSSSSADDRDGEPNAAAPPQPAVPPQPAAPPPPPPPPPPTKTTVTRELLSIAAPMLAALACDPIASLVDTAMLGRLGAAPLASAGVALSVFNTVAKVSNMPLLAATTSAVAAARGEAEKRRGGEGGGGGGAGQDLTTAESAAAAAADDPRTAAATSAVAAALAVGLVQALALAALGGGAALLTAWGVPPTSPLRADADAFLVVRSLGAPATAALLVLQGVFRGLGDASPTFRAALAATLLNVALGYALIFGAGWGAKGAALATCVAQLLPAIWLASALRSRHGVVLGRRWDAATFGALARLVGPAGWLVLRTVSVTGTYAAATALATRAGAGAATVTASAAAAAAAAHQIAFGLWLAASLLSDALAVAAQSLLARSAATGDRTAARAVVVRAVAMAAALGVALGVAIAALSPWLGRLFTSDPAVLSLLSTTLMPVVAATQPVNALAFVLDGVLYGAGGFRFAAVQMFACAVPAVAVMAVPLVVAGGASSSSAATRLAFVWAGLALLMAGRAASIAAALWAGVGPFKGLLSDGKKEEEEGGEGDEGTARPKAA
jgi:putative MATE family efflux protein